VLALADKLKAEQTLLNLVSNAVKFTPKGGEVTLACGRLGAAVTIEVRDTGPGIPAEMLDAIFDPFVQLGRTLTSTHEGAGLGLAISRDLARAMGGDVTVESTPGVGSTFTLRLPAG
jgi:signal transduction histidine kinase